MRVREIDDDEARRLLRINRRGTGSVVTWRRAQMVLLSAQGMPVAKIAEVSFTSDDRVAGRRPSRCPCAARSRRSPSPNRPRRQWAERGGRHKDPAREPRRRRRATYNRYGGVRHLFTALELAKDKLYGHIKPVKRRTQFLEFCRYLRTLYPPDGADRDRLRQLSPYLTTKRCQRAGTWAAATDVVAVMSSR